LHGGEQVTVMAGRKEGRQDELVQINGSDMSFSAVGFFEGGWWVGGAFVAFATWHRDVRCTWRSEQENIDCIIPTSASHLALHFEVIESFACR
jgi:hypothetical protein